MQSCQLPKSKSYLSKILTLIKKVSLKYYKLDSISKDHYLTKALKLNWKPYVPALRLRPFVLLLQFASCQFQKVLF